MARTWLPLTVELLGGRGEHLWPRPGRIFAVGPRHTFADLSAAINDAFARWDRAHLSMFTLADGRIVTDAATAAEWAGSAGGPLTVPLDMAAVRVAQTVELGAEFQFTFDLGDNWVHRCTVGEQLIDPMEQLGIRPPGPLPYWGWGSIPDQYGRRWAEDDGEQRPPRRPAQPHPMLLHAWPGRDQMPRLDLAEVRSAIAAHDSARFLASIAGRDIDDALQQIAEGIPSALGTRSEEAESVALSVINRLTMRGWDGDAVLADDLLARLRGEPLPGRAIPVDLDMLIDEMEGDPELSGVGYIDLTDGRVYPESSTDAAITGEDSVIDVDSEPDRWLQFDRTGSHDAWRDMAAFTERQPPGTVHTELQGSIEGKGAFGRFRDAVHRHGLGDAWQVFSDDRRLGRARVLLVDNGIRAIPRSSE